MKNQKIKRMTGIALLIALVVVLQFVGASIPPVSGFSISLVLIPIVLGAALYGPRAGGILGAAFGVVVAINCITGADAGGSMVFQASPILCILVVMAKGILAGLAAGWAYRLLKDRNPFAAMLAAAVICPTVNTGFFVLSLFTVFPEVLSQWAGGGDVVTYVFAVLLLFNYVPELIINILVSPASQRILHTIEKNN